VKRILRGYLIFGGGYFIFDALLHLSNIKLSSVESIWIFSALSYGQLINILYASFLLLTAGVIFVMQTNLNKYKTLMFVSAIWAIFHGTVLIWLVWSRDYQQIFSLTPSLLVWLPFYREYLTFNSLLLMIYSLLVFFYLRKTKNLA
jgi:hypothetical protein